MAMAPFMINTVLFGLLFLVAFLLLIRQIRSREGFVNAPPRELYDLTLFFKNYPIQAACTFFEKAQPTIQQSFSIDDSGKQLPASVAKIAAETFVKNTIITGLPSCPFTLPESSDLKESYDFVMGLDDKLLSQALNVMVFVVTNLQLSLDNASKAKKEGFITMCSPGEIAAQAVVPLQCIPAEKMKATEQKEIDSVDRFDMETRVSQKEKIATKLQKMVVNMEAFRKEYDGLTKGLASDLQKQVASLETSYNIIKDKETDDEEINKRKQELNINLGLKKSDLSRYVYYNQFAKLSMVDLKKKAEELQTKIDEIQKKTETQGIGGPKS